MKTAVLLMAYGAAATAEDIPAYLLDIRGGRPTSPELIAEVRERYRLMGGRSPLLEITDEQAAALQSRLGVKVFVGMRHSPPTILEAVKAIKAGGYERVAAMPLTPYYSKMSVGAYREKFETAIRETGADFQAVFIESWNDHPKLIDAWAAKVKEALTAIPAKEQSRTGVLFSAHSLPQKIVQENDPYPKELNETVAAVARQVGLGSWEFAYQSKGRTPEPWLGPDVSEIIDRWAKEQKTSMVLVPIGFISDHMETLYDDDILYRQQAQARGIKLIRAKSLNADPLLADAMADVVRRHLDKP